MTMYFFYQEEEKSRWIPALASERKNIIATKKPALVSVLDVDNSFENEADMTPAEIDGTKYFGPFYLDLDGDPEERQEVIDSAKQVIVTLKSKGVDVDSVRIFLSGKKGFHFEVPLETFVPKVMPHGIAGLPDIYREMAKALDIPFYDARIYTRKRGRMWRSPNVLRDNGKFKVQVTADELTALTLEKYDELCSQPRGALAISAPTYSPDFAILYTVAREKTERDAVKAKSRKSKSNPTVELVKKFGKEWPETIEHICAGVIVQDGVGWNRISLQLAVTANALGKKEEELLELAQPLINSHKGDGGRYSTPGKRRRDLREMYRYASVNQSLEFSVGGVLSLVKPECRANADIVMGDYVADVETVQTVAEDGTVTTKEVPIEIDDGPISISKSGIFVKTDDGIKCVCSLGMTDPLLLKKMDGDHLGYEVSVYYKGKPVGRQLLSMDRFGSRQAFQSWSLKWSASMSGSDTHTSRLADVLAGRTENKKDICYTVIREGLDFVKKPEMKEGDSQHWESIWVSHEKVIAFSDIKYRLRSNLSDVAIYKSDLMDAPEVSEEDAEAVEHLIEINQPEQLAKLLGWFSAAFATQIIRRMFKKFPLLQVYGQSGAGKSETTRMLHHLHYWKVAPVSHQSGSTTFYPMLVNVASSASLPVIFEEVKKSTMVSNDRAKLIDLMKNNYDGHDNSRGGLSKDTSNKSVVVNRFENVAPVVYVGEQIINETALIERSVIVSLSKMSRAGRSDHCAWFKGRHDAHLGKIGKSIAADIMASDPQIFVDQINAIERSLRGKAMETVGEEKADDASRPIYNLAVVIFGLDLFASALRRAFGSRFDAKIEALKDSIVEKIEDVLPDNMDEASKVLNTMAYLTRSSNPDWTLVHGRDYTLSDDGRKLDIKLRNAYSVYVRHQRAHGSEILFDNEGSFVAAMYNHSTILKRVCNDNTLLFDSPRAIVCRFSVPKLEALGVDAFK